MSIDVLVLDDSLTVRMDLSKSLTEAGFDVTLCANVASAREALAVKRFALAILDVVLPDGDGIELLGALKSAPETQSMPIMLLTTEVEVRDRVRGLRTGADAYLGKPYDTENVVAKARALTRARESLPAIGTQTTVLVIDDSATYRAALRGALEAKGHVVVTAETGEQGLRVAADVRPDAIVVDGVLPGIDGPTVIRRIRADAATRRTPCLLLTAAGDEHSEVRALDAGADAFVRKDEDTGVVLARLAALLRSAGARAALATPESLLTQKRILAVDDSRTYLEALSEQLRAEGYDVILASSGEDALELLDVERVDCILLDMVMPGLSGEDTCRRIKATPSLRDVPVVMLTAREERDAMIDGINAGADDFISKSSELEVLKARLRAQLRRRQFEEENRGIREELLRKELEATEARSARALAERESAFKSKFLASMSHELRTPLNAIIGFSELMDQGIAGELTETQHEFVRNVLMSGQHLLTLINEILDLSKIEAGKSELRREWTSLDGIVDAVRGVIGPLADQARVEVAITVQKDLPAVYVDPVRIKQVLYNLLSNGIKFTPAEGRVDLEARARGAMLEIRVRDTGIGIREEDMHKLFREFEQIEPTSGVKPQGTGLGLALTKRLVELHGGHVEVRSEPEHGTEFTVTLPLLRRADGSVVPPSMAEGAPGDALVLVVEDDPHAAELIAGHVRAAGLGAIFAATADEAMRLAVEMQPVAITLDLLMPGTDGWAILSQLKETPATAAIPVVIVSVVDDPGRGLVLGATDYLVKPVTREALLHSLESVGAPLKRIAGVQVLLVGEASAELDTVEAHLRGAGCNVRRSPSLTVEALTVPVVVDVALVDAALPTSPMDDEARAKARSASIPILGLLDPKTGDARGAQLESLSMSDALAPDKLVRAVRHAADHFRLGGALWHAGTGLPSTAGLRSHVETLLSRSLCPEVHVIVARVGLPSTPGPTPWSRLLRPHLLRGDFVAVADEDAIALVACEASATGAAHRMKEALRRGLLGHAGAVGVASYPEDGRTAESLVSRALERAPRKGVP